MGELIEGFRSREGEGEMDERERCVETMMEV
jgi:hypothetical protein